MSFHLYSCLWVLFFLLRVLHHRCPTFCCHSTTKRHPKICGVKIDHCHFYCPQGYFSLRSLACSLFSRLSACLVPTEMREINKQPLWRTPSLQFIPRSSHLASRHCFRFAQSRPALTLGRRPNLRRSFTSARNNFSWPEPATGPSV